MLEDMKHQLDKLTVSDILSYLCTRVFSMEESMYREAKQLTEAKEIIRNLLRVTYGEGWNYSLDWKVKAEKFLEKVEK